MRGSTAFGCLDPVDISEVAHVSSSPVFEELAREIMAMPPEAEEFVYDTADSLQLHHQPQRRVRPAVAFAVVIVVAIVASLLVLGGQNSAPETLKTTPWHAAHSLPVARGGSTHTRTGTWKLVDDVLSGTWQQNTEGPPGGSFTCPTTSTCYMMSAQYASPRAGAALLSVSLYVSTDVGSTWSVIPMPRGFAPTSQIECSGVSDCAAGGTYNGKSVLATTNDGGHSFAIAPLPRGVGNLYQLSCTSSDFCAGLAAVTAIGGSPSDPTFLSTGDDGATFENAPILPGDSMQSLRCVSDLECIAIGTSDGSSGRDPTSGVVARTTDGGTSWTAGALPAGFGIDQLSQLSCPDALHCSVTGLIAITVKNPPQCASVPFPQGPAGDSTRPTPYSAPGPAVQRVAQVESAAASAANQKLTNGFSCSSTGQSLVTDIASTTDGGLSWTPDLLPADVPQPQLMGLSCPTDDECWATGSEAVPQQIGNTYNGGSSVVLGTTDGGSTWSKVTFSVPSGAPNYYGQSYLSIGGIDCPSAGVCVALGVTAQGSPNAPVYSLVVPGSS